MTKEGDGVKRIDPKEFMDFGFLHEVNRQFLHPLGMALEVIIDEEDGSVRFGGVWDYRDDPEGMIFAELDQEKIKRIEKFMNKKHAERVMVLGFVIQDREISKEDYQKIKESLKER